MIWQVIKKQALTFLRNPQHLLMLIGLPIILITILSIALGGLMSGEVPNLHAKVAITKYDEQEDLDRFLQELDGLDLSDQEKQGIMNTAEQLKIVQLLKDEVFPSFREQIEIELVSKNDLSRITKDDSYTSVIDIPEDFTYDLLAYVFLNKGEQPQVQLLINEEKQLGSNIVKNTLEEFNEQLSFISHAAKEGIDVSDLIASNIEVESALRMKSWNFKPYSAKEYYTFAMAVMNVLFIASTIGSYAYREKRTHIFNRILISDVSEWKYFLGIYFSTIIFAFIQLMVILLAAKLIFNVTLDNRVGLVLVSLALSCAVGGVAVLLTAISYRMNSEVLTNYFQSIVVSIFAFIGGSFFPVGNYSEILRNLGNLTPNGAGLSAYLLILQNYYEFSEPVMFHIYYLIAFSIVMILISVFIFPKRGQRQ